jgi:hypothetical protein
VFPARFTGRAGPAGTGEFYTGVRPGATGVAERLTYESGQVYWAFSSGGAWLVCDRDEVELTGGEI